MRTAEGTSSATGTNLEPGSVSRATCGQPIEEFLRVVGQRVRRQRALMHMSRRRLAECSGVSERYLAQLERGQGNMSIALLRRVAGALEVSLPELVADGDADARAARGTRS